MKKTYVIEVDWNDETTAGAESCGSTPDQLATITTDIMKTGEETGTINIQSAMKSMMDNGEITGSDLVAFASHSISKSIMKTQLMTKGLSGLLKGLLDD